MSEELQLLEKPLLTWYQKNARKLPWRENPTPYWVWISEIMLQQTRVEAVKEYYVRFLERLPDIVSLSEVGEEELLKLWEGLGYYSRARNLKKAAIQVMQEYGGTLPEKPEQLKRLAGIGNYTAGAIASIAYGLPVPAVDGNVLRVLSRVMGKDWDISQPSVKKQMEQELSPIIPGDHASSFNQGLFEVGATVCLPNGKPLCQGGCPFQEFCKAYRENLTERIPVKAAPAARRIEEWTICVMETENRFALVKRSDKGLLASMYEFPVLEGFVKAGELTAKLGLEKDNVMAVEKLPAARHIFSHVEWHMRGYRIHLRNCQKVAYLWAELDELAERYPIPAALKVYLREIRRNKK